MKKVNEINEKINEIHKINRIKEKNVIHNTAHICGNHMLYDSQKALDKIQHPLCFLKGNNERMSSRNSLMT